MPDVPSGNRNLLKNSKAFTGSNITGSSTILNETYQGCTVRYFKNTNPNSNLQDFAQFLSCVTPNSEGEYVASFWAKGSGTTRVFFYNGLAVDSFVTNQGVSESRGDGRATFTLSENWERYWVKYKLRATTEQQTVAKNLLFRHDNNSTEDETYLAGVQLEEGNVVTDYSQAPEDLGWSTATLVPTQQQRYLWKFEYIYYSDGSVEVTAPVNLSIAGADADTTGVTDAINQTNQTVVNLQNSVSQAQSDLATVSSNLTQARQNLESSIASVNTKAQAVETTLAQVQSTANSNSQKTAMLENDLNGLSAKFEKIEGKLGGLLTNLAANWQNKYVVISGASTGSFIQQDSTTRISPKDFIKVEAGNEYTISLKELSDVDYYFKVTMSTVNSYGVANSRLNEDEWIRTETYTFTAPEGCNYVMISVGCDSGVTPDDLNTKFNINLIDWISIETKLADYKQTADQNYASLQSTVQALDGTITANKATADQTAQGFSTRIESLETYKDGETTRANQYFEAAKTETARQLTAERTAIANDYVAKSTYTSDVTGLRNDLTATTTTANTTKTNLASYQTSNDQAVASLQSSLQTANGSISSLQTQVNAVPGQITSAVSAVEGKIPTEIGSSNLLRKTAVNTDNLKLFSTSNATISVVEKDGHQTYKIEVGPTQQNNSGAQFAGNDNYYNLVKDRYYTFSYWIWTSVDKQLNLYKLGHIQICNYHDDKVGSDSVHQHTTPIYSTDKILAEQWTKVWYTFKVTSNSYFKPFFWYLNADDEIYIYDMMLNEGKVPLSYTLAIEDTQSDITKLSSELTQTKAGMTLLATKTELNSAKTELQSGITTATSKADSAQATANSNAQTISTHTTQISALNTGLQAKVSQSDFDSLSGRVTTAESNLTATASQLSSQISSVNERIPTKIGGRNYLTNEPSNWQNKYVIVNGASAGSFLQQNSSTRISPKNFIAVEAGKQYTISLKELADVDYYFKVTMSTVDAYGTANSMLNRDEWIYSESYTFTAPENCNYVMISVGCDSGVAPDDLNSKFNIKLEKGSIATDYSPAPEDYDAALTQAKSEIKQTTDAITASVSSVQTAANNAQSTANTAVSKADAAQAGVNTLDSTTVKSASLNLDNNGFVTKVGKTIDGNKFATMIAQDANNVKIIADEMQVTANMIVDGAVTAEKLDVNNLSAVTANLGDMTSGSITNTFTSGTRSGSVKIGNGVEITTVDTSGYLPEKAKTYSHFSDDALSFSSSTSNDEPTHSMMIMPEMISYTKHNYDTSSGGTGGWTLRHNGHYSMLEVDMVWQNVRLSNTSELPYGVRADYVRIGNLVTVSVNRQITSIAAVTENQLANETIPEGFRPISQAHLTLTGNTGSTIDATCIVHLNPDGTIRFTNNKSGNRVWTGTVTYTCVEAMPYSTSNNNISTI